MNFEMSENDRKLDGLRKQFIRETGKTPEQETEDSMKMLVYVFLFGVFFWILIGLYFADRWGLIEWV